MFAGLLSEDFPEILDPMVVKEFRQGLRARQFVLPFVAVQAVMFVVALSEWLDLSDGAADWWLFQDGSRRFAPSFWGGVGIMMLVVIPFSRFFDVQQEFAGRNAELLLLSGVDRWRIVRGKWMVAVLTSVLVLVSVFPYLLLRYFFGGLEWAPNLLIGVGLLVNGAVLSALVIGVSAYQSMGARIGLLIGGGFISSLCVSLPGLAAAMMIEQPGVSGFLLWMVIGNGLVAACLLCILGLQMARVKLRVYEDPLDPAVASQVVVLYFFAPVLIGIPAAIFGVPGIISGLFFSWISLLIDRPPKQNQRAFYAQS
jgi:hypothetical protein